MDVKEISSIIESILFASGDPVSIDRLCLILDIDRITIETIIHNMSDEYDFERRGIRLVKLDETVQLCTRVEYADYIRKALETRKPSALSQAALEVLSIVAYRQPVTRAYVEQVRGVDSSGTISNLVEKDLIRECGRLDVPGRPMLFCTTETFLRSFGLPSVSDLPQLSDVTDEESGEQLSLLLTPEEK